MTAEYIATRDIPLDELTPFPGNAKRGDVDAIRASLRRNGQYRSLTVRDLDGAYIVLAGNHTMQALGSEGHEAARCEVIRCDDATARRINLVDNRSAELGSYDDQALTELLQAAAADDGDLLGTGWTDADLDLLASEPPSLDALADELGEPEDDDLWPTLRFKVPPAVRNDFYDLTAGCATPDDDNARFMHLIQRVRSSE